MKMRFYTNSRFGSQVVFDKANKIVMYLDELHEQTINTTVNKETRPIKADRWISVCYFFGNTFETCYL